MKPLFCRPWGDTLLWLRKGQEVFTLCTRSSARIERQIADLEVVGSNPAGCTIFNIKFGAVAQLARALPWHGRGQGFKSPQLHHL